MATFKILSYAFTGPLPHFDELKDEAGVYVILGTNYDEWRIVDVGEAVAVKTEVYNSGRVDCWKEQNYAHVAVAVLYANALGEREEMTREIRQNFNPPCG